MSSSPTNSSSPSSPPALMLPASTGPSASPGSAPSAPSSSAQPATPFQPLDRAARARIVSEAITLPLIFLTVAFGGGLRVTAANHQLVFLPPSLMALILALLLLGALVRTGTLAPDQLMRGDRQPLANLSGLVVLITLFAAAAQVFNTMTPETGLLQFIVNLFFLLLLWNTVAAQPDRRRMISSLMVIVGGAFVLKYVVLGTLYDPAGGLTKRVLMTLLEGVTLGGLTYQAPAPATGYVAFFTLLLFLIGVTLLPQRPPGPAWRRQPMIEGEPAAALVVDADG